MCACVRACVRADGHVIGVCVGHRSVARVATGVTWARVIHHAPWGERSGHTTVIDAAGAIYVLGGFGLGDHGGLIYYKDVWASTDGGADRTRKG